MNETLLTIPSLIESRRSDKFKLYERYVNPQRIAALRRAGAARQYVAADGSYLYDEQGNDYLDCDAGYGVFAVGRNHPHLRAAMHDALELRLPNMVGRDVPLLAGMVAETLASRMPGGAYRALFTNSGSETTEAALKFARRVTGKTRFLYLEGDFHGVTYGALSVTDTGETLRKMGDGFGPLLPGCQRVPWNDIECLENELRQEDAAALILEPIQGTTVRPLPAAYLRAAQTLCSRHGALFIVDEVLTGVGRTGRFYACDHAGIAPDMVLLSKALSGGCVPIGALLVRSDVHAQAYRTPSAFVHGSTFGENDFGMVAALATLQVIDDEGLVDRAARLGAQLLERLKALQSRYDMITDVRGTGLLIGIEMAAPRAWGSRLSGTMLQRRGLLGHLMAMQLLVHHRVLASTGARNNVLRLHPPLIMNDRDADRVLQSLELAFERSYRFPDGIGRFLLAELLKQAAPRVRTREHP